MVFSTNQNTVIKLNYEPQLEKLQNVLNMWRDRDFSLIGKTVIWKALAISKLVFLFSSLPNPDGNFFCRLKKIIQCFLWNNKPPKIKYSILANETEQGGLRRPDPKCFCESLKLKWVKNILNEDASCIWKILIENQLEFVGGNLIWQCSFNDKDHLLSKIKSRFLLDVLMAWSHFRFQYGDKGCSLNENEVMWNNSTIKINGVSVFYKHWYRKGIYKIAHVMDDSKKFLPFEHFQAKFPELTCNYLEYQGIVSAIKHSKCFLEFKEKDAINYILQQNKVSKTAYRSLHCQKLYRVSSKMQTGMASHLPRQNVSMATHF